MTSEIRMANSAGRRSSQIKFGGSLVLFTYFLFPNKYETLTLITNLISKFYFVPKKGKYLHNF